MTRITIVKKPIQNTIYVYLQYLLFIVFILLLGKQIYKDFIQTDFAKAITGFPFITSAMKFSEEQLFSYRLFQILIVLSFIFLIYQLYSIYDYFKNQPGTTQHKLLFLKDHEFWLETFIVSLLFSIPPLLLTTDVTKYSSSLGFFFLGFLVNIAWELNGFYKYIYKTDYTQCKLTDSNNVLDMDNCDIAETFTTQFEEKNYLYGLIFVFFIIALIGLPAVATFFSKFKHPQNWEKIFLTGLVAGLLGVVVCQYVNYRRSGKMFDSKYSLIIFLKFFAHPVCWAYAGVLA